MPTPLLATKLSVPPAQPRLISRPRLTAYLDEGLSRPLTLLSAPPGFGKTSLLSEWLSRRQTPAAWVSLDEGDNDPARFLNYLVAAFQSVHARVGPACQPLLDLPQPAPAEVILTALLNELAAAPGPTLPTTPPERSAGGGAPFATARGQAPIAPTQGQAPIAPTQGQAAVSPLSDGVGPPTPLPQPAGSSSEGRGAVGTLEPKAPREWVGRSGGGPPSSQLGGRWAEGGAGTLEDRPPCQTLLVLDDYHLITSQPVHDAVAFLLNHQPPGLHVILATRADPPLPLALWRARGQLTELRSPDLRFNAGEAAEFLNLVMGLKLSADQVAALVGRTEGWIAGLQLAALSMRSHEDPAGFIQAFAGTNRFVLDFLIEEVLDRQPEDLQNFLVQTSILNRLSAPLCDALTGRGDGQATLELLEQANLFLIPLDEERRWYRYHNLFADLLRKRLGQTQANALPLLHSRASDWLAANGFMAEAIDHALGAQDFERAAQQIEGAAGATLMRSESVTLRNWINGLPEALVRARPLLCVYHALVLLLGGSSLEAVEARLQLLKGESTPLALPLWALVSNYRGDPAGAITSSQRALEQLPENEAFLRGMAALNLAAAYHTQGDIASSQRVLQDAALAGRQAGNVMIAVNAICYRADLWRREGHLRQARSLYQQALEVATSQGGGRLPVAGRALIGLGEVAREWNDLDAATHYIHEGIELAGLWAQAGTLEAYFTLARIRQAHADWGGVQEALRAMRQVAVEFKATEVDDRLVDLVEAWMQIAQGDLEGPRRWAERYGLSRNVDPLKLQESDEVTFRRLRKYEYPVAARLWIAEGRPAEAAALLESALPIAEAARRIGLAIEYEILIGLSAQALGLREKALQAVERALARAEPEGYVRIFVDEGKPMARLLYEAAAGQIRPDYVGRLLAALTTARPSPPKQPEMIEPLSEREVEVLRMVAQGLSNEEIAQGLVLSLPTVKWHTSNIYGKLGAKNRTQAVAMARALGILPEHG